MHSGRRGFTLIELLVVVTIIGLLSTMAVVALNSARKKARDSKRVSDIKQIMTALELFYYDNARYVSADPAMVIGEGGNEALCSGGFKASCAPGDTVYMGNVPKAPDPADGSCTSTQNDYMYRAANGLDFTITFCLGNAFGVFGAGLHTARSSGIE